MSARVRKTRPTRGIPGWTVLTADDAEQGFYASEDEHMAKFDGNPPGLEWARQHSPTVAKSLTGGDADELDTAGREFAKRIHDAPPVEAEALARELTDRAPQLHETFKAAVVDELDDLAKTSFTERTGRQSSGDKPAQRLDPGSFQRTPPPLHGRGGEAKTVQEIRDSEFYQPYAAGGEFSRHFARAAREILSAPAKQRLHEIEVKEFFRGIKPTGPPPGVPRNGRRTIT